LQKQNSLTKSYNDGWNEVASFVTDMSSMIIEIEDLYSKDGLLGYKNVLNINSTGKTKIKLGESSFYLAKKSLEDTVKFYKTLSRTSSNEDILKLIEHIL
jgi:hypothetical protein